MANKDQDDGQDNPDNDHNDNKKKYAAMMPNRKYAYFRDDQIVFLVNHPKNLIPGQQLTKFQVAIDDELSGFKNEFIRKPHQAAVDKEPIGLKSEFISKPLEVVSFPKSTRKEIKRSKKYLSTGEAEKITSAFSIIKCDLNVATSNPASLLTTIDGLAKQLTERFQKRPIEGVTLVGALPNWLTSVASQTGGTGGPGGRPFPYFGNRKSAPYRFDIQRQLEKAAGKGIYGDGSGVDVVILDTAPCAQDLVAAYKEWPDHPLIATLLGPNGKLHLYPASYEELLRLGCTSLNDHDYKMTDHGLFIAGIVHSIVPNAEIHLIEVLNQYGVGDLTSFVQGLLKVYTEKIYNQNRKLVINCSWMLENPLDDLHCRHMKQTGDPDAEFEKAVREFSRNDQATRVMLDSLFDRFFALGRQAFAAAGNDGRNDDSSRVQARYPAALKSVAGVGALPKALTRTGDQRNNYLPTEFSNLSESADSRGVVTKGVVTLGGEEGEGNGVLGLYIGEFPDCSRNESKWAWWCGTSFATPILTGAVASVLSRKGNRVVTTQAAIKKLYGKGAKIIKDGQAGKQEDALPVTQG